MTSVTRIDTSKETNANFNKAFLSRDRDLFLYGSAGAGKTYTAAQKLILKCVKYPARKIVVIRKYRPSLQRTCFDLLTALNNKWQLEAEVNLAEL